MNANHMFTEQEEVDAAYEENDGNMPDYNTVLNLPYMEQCIMETLRHTSLIGRIWQLDTSSIKQR